MLLFAFNTPIPDLFLGLRKIGLNKDIAELTILIYRYSFMIFEQLEQMLIAADCRLGFRNIKSTLNSFGIISANLFLKSLDFSQRAFYSLQSKNFSGNFEPFKKPKNISILNVLFSILIFIIILFFGSFEVF
jgi:energy-coupling factor transporter transmembrane protein EcfT